MTLSQLQQFHGVCTFGSVTKAAESLHISQPSISNSIKELETEFKVNLFYREGRKMTLTREGEFCLERVSQVLAGVRRLSEQMEDLANNKNSFRIGVPPMTGTIVFHKMYCAFTKAYPDITMRITETGSVYSRKLLEDDSLDIAMAAICEEPDPWFQFMRLFESKLMFCVCPNHPLANAKEIDLPTLEKEPIILFREDSVPAQTVLRSYQKIGISPNVLMYFNQLSMIQQFIAGGTAGAFLLEEVARAEPGIIAIPLREPIIMDIVLLWPRNKYIYSNLATFIEFARGYKEQWL